MTIPSSEAPEDPGKDKQLEILENKDKELSAIEAEAIAEQPVPGDPKAGQGAPEGTIIPEFEAQGLLAMALFMTFDLILGMNKKPKLSEEQKASLKPIYNKLEEKYLPKLLPAGWELETEAGIMTVGVLGSNFLIKEPEKKPEDIPPQVAKPEGAQ